jgi:hypothetical protein
MTPHSDTDKKLRLMNCSETFSSLARPSSPPLLLLAHSDQGLGEISSGEAPDRLCPHDSLRVQRSQSVAAVHSDVLGPNHTLRRIKINALIAPSLTPHRWRPSPSLSLSSPHSDYFVSIFLLPLSLLLLTSSLAYLLACLPRV